MTTGLISVAGCTPALSALQSDGAFTLKIASANMLRKVFSTQTKSTVEYYRLLETMCSQLHDSHTGINVPNELFLETYSRPPLDTRHVDGKVLVARVLDPRLAKDGIRPGLEIVSVDRVPVQRYAQERVAPYHSWSTPQGYLVGTYEFYLLCGPGRTPVEIEFLDERGRTFTRTVGRS